MRWATSTRTPLSARNNLAVIRDELSQYILGFIRDPVRPARNVHSIANRKP
jgi:hypothetical protein